MLSVDRESVGRKRVKCRAGESIKSAADESVKCGTKESVKRCMRGGGRTLSQRSEINKRVESEC